MADIDKIEKVLPMYRMAIFGGNVFKYSWAIKENPKLDYGCYEDDMIIKAFAKQQDEFVDPLDVWYIGAWFKKYDDPINDNKGHIFPSHIPLNCVMGKRTGDIVEFSLGENPETREEITIRVECDQSIVPGYNPSKWLDEDPAYSQDPFVAEYSNAVFRRLETPYHINYNKVDKERAERQAIITENLNRMFKAAGVKVIKHETSTM